MLNFCSIVVAILKMATSRNCSKSGINSRHHYLPTYQVLMILDNVEFLPLIFLCRVLAAILKMADILKILKMSRIDSRLWTISTGRHFQNGHHNTAKIQHCPISSKFDMWVDNDVPNWFATLKNFYRSPFSKWSMNFLLLFLQNRPSRTLLIHLYCIQFSD
jgi:hypothetical protein